MAFNRDNFSVSTVAQGSNAPKLHTYKTTADNKAAVIASGYFNDLSSFLKPGDFIFSDASDGPIVVGVNTNTSGVVTTLSVALA